jgi:ubiquinone/menaquinone biosynthesis C-methylase UbiE
MASFGEAITDYCCPLCNGTVTCCKNLIVCGSCSAQFPQLSGGIPDFSINRGFYYGTFEQSVMQSLLQKMDHLNWRSAIKQIRRELPTRKHHSLLGQLQEARAGWKYLLGVSKDKRVLDYGGGIGSVTVSLARSFREVVCLDLTGDRLLFGKKRAEQLGLTNVAFVKGGDTPYLPFPEKCFDVVILNGVLGWIPESYQKAPELAQLDALREVHRVLNADGQIYLGIENRFSYKYFLGHKEDHTGLLFGALLPRRIANVYSLAARGKPYKTYTYSVSGYKRLLRSAGFTSSEFFVPYPSYRRFSRIVTMAHDKRKKKPSMIGAGGYSPSAAFFNKRLLKYLAPAFFITASKGKNPPSFLEQLINGVMRQLTESGRTYESAEMQHILVSPGKIMAFVDSSAGGYGHEKRPDFVIKIPLTPYGERRLERNIKALEGIRNHIPVLRSMLPYVPRGFFKGSLAGQPYFVEEWLPGVCAENPRLSMSERAELMRSAIDLLTQLHTSTLRHTRIDEPIFRKLFIKPIFEVADFLEYEKESHTLTHITSMLRKTVLGASLPLVWSHGDFSLKNLTVSQSPLRMTGLIDWDLSRKVSLPLLDLFHLIARERMVDEGLTLHGALRKYLFPLALEPVNNQLLSNYVSTLAIDHSVIPALCIMYWISRIHGHIGSLNDLDSDWVNKNFVAVAEDITPNLY